MSQGLGELQEQILSFLSDRTSSEGGVTLEVMRWSLYEVIGRPPVGADAKLPTKWNTSFRRAANTLSKRRKITIKKRRLENLKECAQHYPSKTLHAQKRHLRLEFLPVLADWDIGPKYTLSENEAYYIEKLDEPILAELETKWTEIEKSLRGIYGRIDGNRVDDLLLLICKGRSLFRCREPFGDDVKVRAALGNLIYHATGENLLPVDLVAALREFNHEFFPKHMAATLRLKSFVHEMVDISTHRKWRLNAKSLGYLHQQKKALVEQMPGFRRKGPTKPGRPTWMGESPQCDYDPQLEELIDRTIFQKFNFVTLC